MKLYTQIKKNNKLIPLTSYNDKMLCRVPKGYKWILLKWNDLFSGKRVYAEVLNDAKGRLVCTVAGNCEIMRTQREQVYIKKMCNDMKTSIPLVRQ